MIPDPSLEGRSVFVTGATGFIGAYLCARLSWKGARLSVLIHRRAGGDEVPGRPALPEGIRVFRGDVRDREGLARAVRAAAPEVVFHLAAVTDVARDPGLADPCRAVNIEGTRNLAAALAGVPVRRVVHFGTCEEYGDGEAPFREDAPVRPVSPYSASKAAATLFMQDLGRRGVLPVVVVRPFLAYGPGQAPERFLAACTAAAVEDREFPMTPGFQTREFNHVEDLVRGALAAAAAEGVEGEIVNLACGEEHRLRDVAERVFRLAGASARPRFGALPYRPGEAMRFFGDTEKCRRLLGYVPAVPFEEGLARLVARARADRAARRDGRA